MSTPDYTTTLLVDQTTKEVFDAITNPRGWWSDGIEGSTAKLNDEFIYRYKDMHYSKQKLVEVVPNKKVTWLVTDSNLFFSKKGKDAWTDTRISFEIAKKDNKTQLLVTHQGLVPGLEWYESCSGGWNHYIHESLLPLISTGQGSPDRVSFTTTLLVTQTPKEVFNAINNVRGWWSSGIEGVTNKLHAEFLHHYEDVHTAKMKIIEFIPEKKVTWLVLDNHFNFVKDEREWKNTMICFEISKKGNETQLIFTHMGLVPQYECFDLCQDAWTQFIRHSLYSLVTTGKGQPTPKDDVQPTPIKRWKLSNS